MSIVTARATRVIVGFAAVALGVVLALIGAHGTAAGAGTVAVQVKQSTVADYQGCAGTGGAYFVITQITSPPDSISVALSNGSTVTAPLVKAPGKTAHYSYSFASSGVSVVDATAQVPEGWSGQFNISHCLEGAPSSSSAPSSSGSSGSSSAPSSGYSAPSSASS